MIESKVIKGIKVIRCSDPDKVVADMIASQIKSNPKSVLGLATGSTPISTYENLIEMKLDWSSVSTFNLDEYEGIKQSNPQSYYSFMHSHLFDKININPSNIHFLNSETKNVSEEVKNYEKSISESKIDL